MQASARLLKSTTRVTSKRLFSINPSLTSTRSLLTSTSLRPSLYTITKSSSTFTHPRFLATHTSTMSPSVNTWTNNPGLIYTSGRNDPVWIATQPYESYPKFPKLDKDVETHTVVVGAGMAGISTAYELVKKGIKTVLIEAREVTSGETGRTSGHLSDNLGERYSELIKIHGVDGAKLLYESHQYAIQHVGDVAKELNIKCEYRNLPGYMIVEVPSTDAKYDELNDLDGEPDAYKQIGYPNVIEHTKNEKLGAYTGAINKLKNEATFHPTKYLHGILNTLKEKHSDLFSCYTETRMRTYKVASGGDIIVETEGALPPNPKPFSNAKGHEIKAKNLIMTTNAPLNALDLILKEAYYRTYCIATKIPASDAPSYLLYDNGDPYIYVRVTDHPDSQYKYLVVGGEDHKVGQETTEGYKTEHYEKLTKWTKQHFPTASDSPDFAWSGQVLEANDNAAYIGRDSTLGSNVFVSTGDCGNGLTHSVIASRLLTDIITGVDNPWAELYSPSRQPKARTIIDVVTENVSQAKGWVRALTSDVSDIEDIPRCSGAVMHGGLSKLGKPLAVYKDGEGEVRTFSAVCPHAHAIVAWNATEGTWDCPAHGSRFDGQTGKCVMGPSNRGLSGDDEAADKAIDQATSG